MKDDILFEPSEKLPVPKGVKTARGELEREYRNADEQESDSITGSILGRLVCTDDTPNLFKQHFRLDAGKFTHAGKMVAVEAKNAEGNDVYILARVNNAREFNPHEDVLSSTVQAVIPFERRYAEEGASTVIYRVAEIEPLEEAVLDEARQVVEIKSVETLPKAGATVYEAGAKLTAYALGLKEEPDDGIHVGHAHGDATVPIVLDRGVIQRHIFIGGGVGSGKSYTRGVLAEELHCLGVPQINIDINGEMIDATEELGGLNLVPAKDFTLPLSALTAGDIINAAPSLTGNMLDLVSHAHEELLKESMKTGGYFLVDDLLRKIDEVAPQLGMKPVTVKPAKSRTESLKRIKYLGEPYDWPNAIRPGAIINIVCRGMLVSDLRIITASVARDIQRLARAKKIGFVILSIDEFHLVAPAREETVALQVLRELARIGRHFKIGLILTTQSPQDVDKSILKRLLTRFLHAIEPDQLEALRGVFSDASEELVKQLPKLPVGTCILTGAFETIRHATVVKIRERMTTHGGATPDIWADIEAAGWKGKKKLELL